MATQSLVIGRSIYFVVEICGASICFFITIGLIRMLYCRQASAQQALSKQIMHPTAKMKICSIACGCVLFSGFVMKSIMMASAMDGEDMHNAFVCVLWHLSVLCMKSGQVLYFKYFVLSIRKLYRSNDIARMAISKPMVIWTEILILCNILIIFAYAAFRLSQINSNHGQKERNLMAIIYRVVVLVFSLMIDLSLIYCLKSIIDNYVRNWRFNASGFVNDQQHALLLMMTRYCSIIIISATIDIFNTALQVFQIFIGNNFFRQEHEVWTILAGVFVCINASTFAIAIYFSFSINNLFYEKYCYCCHNAIYGSAQRTIAQRHSADMDGYIMMAGTNSLSGYNPHRASLQTASSSRKETNYFDANLYVE